MLQVTDIRVRSFSLTRLDVYWRIADTYDQVHMSRFQVLRSEAPEGPYLPVSPEFTDTYHFQDTSVDLRSPHTIWYYRIRATDGLTDAVQDFPAAGGASLTARPSLRALEAARMHRLAFEYEESGGRSVWIFPRRTFGQRCACTNAVTQVREDDRCPTCFGTGYVGGYWRPIRVAADVGSDVRNLVAFPERKLQAGQNWLKIADYPRLLPGWVVVELENVRWRISGDPPIKRVDILRYPVFQLAPLESIGRGDVEYDLPVNLADLERFEASPRVAFTSPKTFNALAAELTDMENSLRRPT